jgi:hypothetical protein
MDTYKNYIKDLANSGSDAVFYNSGPQHAALVMGTIFENSDKCVKICAGNFSGEISNSSEYRNGLEIFLRKGGKLQILLQEEKLNNLKKEPELFDFLRFYSIIKPNNIVIKTHKSKFINDEDEVHFTIGDDKMYRLETNIEKFTAVGNFNDNKTAALLTKLFDEVFESTDGDSKTLNLMTVPTNIEPQIVS